MVVVGASVIDHFPQEVGLEKVGTQSTDRISGKAAKSNTADSEAAGSDVTFAFGPFTFPDAERTLRIRKYKFK